MSKFSSFLAPQLESFVAFQQLSLCWNDSYNKNLHYFDDHCNKYFQYSKQLSIEIINSWFNKRQSESQNSYRNRMFPILKFVNYLRQRGLTNIVIDKLAKGETRQYIPHAFTEGELIRFFAACDSIPVISGKLAHPFRKLTIPIFFRLLYSSGIRPKEARLLRRRDVDLENGVLNIVNSKGLGQHFTVLHESMLALMRKYDIAINKQCPDRTFFFPADKDTCYNSKWVINNFRLIWRKSNNSIARTYDLRHNYAIENINSWVNNSFNNYDKLLYLSKSMGHKSLDGTKYYYSLVPKLADILNTQTDESEFIPELYYEEIE
jgi:integrase